MAAKTRRDEKGVLVSFGRRPGDWTCRPRRSPHLRRLQIQASVLDGVMVELVQENGRRLS